MSDAFLGLDPDGRITYLNERAQSLLAPALDGSAGIEQLEGEVLWDALPRARETTLYERFDGVIAAEEPDSYESYYAPVDAWFEVRLYPSESGVSVYFRDVSERREQRERLVDREAALRELYEAIATTDLSFEQRVDELLATGQGVLGTEYGTLSRVTDDEYCFEFVRAPDESVQSGDVLDVSDTYCERVVVEEETLVIGDVEADAPALTDRAGCTDLGVSSYVGTPVYVDDEVYGTLCFYDTAAREDGFTEWETTLVDLMGKWVGTALERRQTAERLRRQNDRLERFAGVLSHDLRNPLQVVHANVELAGEKCDVPELRTAQDAVERMDKMVSDVLAMARAGTAIEETTTVDLASVARDAWDTVETDGSRLETETTSTVEADRKRLVRVFENLVRNSVDHTAGHVRIRVTDTDDGFAVCDDGSGIPPEDRDRVFDHGYTDAEDGTGYGLSIVDEIATAHGWSVAATDSESGGTRVEFTGVG